MRFLNTQSIAPIEIHRQLSQQSFPADFPLLLALNCSGAPVIQKIVPWCIQKQMTPEHKSKRMESALTTVVHLLLHLKKLLYDQRQLFKNDREAMSVTQYNGSNPRQQTSTHRDTKVGLAV